MCRGLGHRTRTFVSHYQTPKRNLDNAESYNLNTCTALVKTPERSILHSMAAIAAQQGLATATYDSKPVQDALSQGALPHKLLYGVTIGGASYVTAPYLSPPEASEACLLPVRQPSSTPVPFRKFVHYSQLFITHKKNHR